jgi:hypothetical protein
MSAQRDRIERSLKRLGFQLGKGRGKAFKITAAAGCVVPNATDTMTLDEIERWIGDHTQAEARLNWEHDDRGTGRILVLR